MKNIPKKIYLQLGDDYLDDWQAADFNNLSEITWCEDRQDEFDLEYVLATETRAYADSPELINEILTKYHEWAINTPSKTFKKWEEEEGDFHKTKARIRKEFIEFLNKQNK